jgi:hypothetical protein
MSIWRWVGGTIGAALSGAITVGIVALVNVNTTLARLETSFTEYRRSSTETINEIKSLQANGSIGRYTIQDAANDKRLMLDSVNNQIANLTNILVVNGERNMAQDASISELEKQVARIEERLKKQPN